VSSTLFPGLDSLVGLAQHGVDVKPTLLRVLTDLYVQKAAHAHDEERQYVELALRLIDSVDDATRQAVARRLSAYPNAPAEIVNRLGGNRANRAGKAASAPAALRDPVEAPAEPECAPAPAGNTAAIGAQFFAAEPAQRAAILAALDARGPLDLMTTPAPTEDVVRRLEASALGGRPSEFIRDLERALGISRALAEAIVNDRSGEPLVVAAKVLAMPIHVLQRILLFVNPAIGHSVRRVYALTGLYDEISLAAALRLAAGWRASSAVAVPASRRSAHPLPGNSVPRRGTPMTAHRRDGASSSGRDDASSANDPVEKVAS
jgi:hypothetical protein